MYVETSCRRQQLMVLPPCSRCSPNFSFFFPFDEDSFFLPPFPFLFCVTRSQQKGSRHFAKASVLSPLSNLDWRYPSPIPPLFLKALPSVCACVCGVCSVHRRGRNPGSVHFSFLWLWKDTCSLIAPLLNSGQLAAFIGLIPSPTFWGCNFWYYWSAML